MKILVTGGNGQLGKMLQLVVDGSQTKENHEWKFCSSKELDITDPENIATILEKENPNVIINCAAYTNVVEAENDPQAWKVNSTGVYNLKKEAKKIKAKIIHISTDYVFGGLQNTPYKEDTYEPNVLNTYGETKLNGEKHLDLRSDMVIRTSWLYSEFPGNFFTKITNKIEVLKTKEIKMVVDQIGTPTYARDLAVFLVYIIENGIHPGIYHYSDEGTATWYDFTCHICKLLDPNHNIKIKPVRSLGTVIRPNYSVLDKDKVKSAYNIEIPYWVDSLERCIKEYNNQKRAQ